MSDALELMIRDEDELRREIWVANMRLNRPGATDIVMVDDPDAAAAIENIRSSDLRRPTSRDTQQ